ncbi:MAG: YceI family protein [Myxococcota bacterium]
MLAVIVAFIACADPAKDKTAATVSEPAPPPAPAAAPAAPAIDPNDAQVLVATGTIGFTGAKVTKSHDGTFGAWEGKLRVKGDKLEGVDFAVDLASVKTDSAKLDDHLKKPDFFDVPTHPKATFRSMDVKDGAPPDNKLEGANATVGGDFTLRGVTKRLEFPAVVTVTPSEVAARTEFVINRQDFGVAYPGKPDDLVRDEVVIRVDVRAPRAATPAADAAPPAPPAGPSPG